ncbi:MAG: CAP domain-containing protein [Bdellovibrionales bacterium]|nr:CAP domain-containing protein [Bdellovibrionales bacterium]
MTIKLILVSMATLLSSCVSVRPTSHGHTPEKVVSRGLPPCLQGYTEQQCSVFRDTNRARMAHGLPPLRGSVSCSYLAQDHSKDMAREQKLSHDSPQFGNFGRRAKAYQLPGTWGAENVAWSSAGNSYYKQVVAGWMDSPGHRANILSPNATAIGIGIFNGYFAQCFTNE